MTPNKIDHIICAEIPDEKMAVIKEDKSGNFHECLESNPLYDLVTSMMLHGPCGPMYTNKSYMRDGYCCLANIRWYYLYGYSISATYRLCIYFGGEIIIVPTSGLMLRFR